MSRCDLGCSCGAHDRKIAETGRGHSRMAMILALEMAALERKEVLVLNDLEPKIKEIREEFDKKATELGWGHLLESARPRRAKETLAQMMTRLGAKAEQP